MMKKILTISLCLILAGQLSGCARFLAAASGPNPVGANEGERTLSERVEDMSIEKTAAINIYKSDQGFKDSHFLIMSFYSNVLLAGQVPNEALKQKAEETLRDMREVKEVHNYLSVQPENTALLTRAKDSVISARIGSSFTFTKEFPSNRCKLLVEDGVVYLMAKLTHAEAEQAMTLIKKNPDVKKIVKLVDYLD